mgnify:FL=1|jgi:hypothetical protein
MSTITVTNIKATGETASRAVSGVAAAWCNYDGTGTASIRDSINIASLTDNGTGSHSISFSNTMDNANYATQVTGAETGSGGDANQLGTLTRDGTYTTSIVSISGTHTNSGNSVDNQRMLVTVNGDLA